MMMVMMDSALIHHVFPILDEWLSEPKLESQGTD